MKYVFALLKPVVRLHRFSFLAKSSPLLLVFLISSCLSDETDVVKDNYPLLGAGFGINSSTVIVNDLQKTRNYFADTLGFEMPENDGFDKGLHEGSIFTSIDFPDMSYIEFLAIEDSLVTDNTPHFIEDFLAIGEGVQSYSLSSSSVDTTYSWLTQQGFSMDSVKSYRTSTEAATGWSGDDGGSQELSLEFQGSNSASYLPKFIQDAGSDYKKMLKERKTYYAYYRSFTNHPNGAVGISAIQIVVDSLDAASKRFRQMGLEELSSGDSKNIGRFRLKRNQEIEIKVADSNDDLTSFFQERGSGVYGFRIEVQNLDSTYHFLSQKLPAAAMNYDTVQNRVTVLRQYAHGIQLEFVKEPEDQALLAEQLKIGGKLDSAAIKNAQSMYTKYCALCHGENREGYAADNAPSLRSKSLLATSKTTNFLRYTIQYGRSGTAMAGYLNSQGGPMEYIEIEILLQWLYETSGVEEPVKLSREPIAGNIDLGAEIYAQNCAVCHGSNGEGISAPALGNPMLLATATDEFLKYAIAEGRDGTPMISFKDSLSDEEINNVTAFLRSRASGWNIPKGDTITIPTPDQYVLNPDNRAPKFDLREDLYVSAKQVYEALQDSARMIILDARSEVAWRQTHIPGSIPVPYYEDPEVFVENIPNDSTWIVAYCACPHAASGRVVNTLKRYGYKNTAIIDEGVLVWAQLGYPVKHGH